MPLVNIPNVGIVKFPDSMDNEAIERAIEGELFAIQQRKLEEDQDKGIVAGLHLQTLGNELVGNIQQAGIGIAQGMARLSEGANKLLETAVRHFGQTGTERNDALIEQFSGATEIARKSATELGALGDETPGSPLTRAIAGGVVSAAPSIAAAPLGLPAMAAAGALQQFGASLGDYEAALLAQGESPESARAKALIPALSSGLITGLVTAGFGRTGIEALNNVSGDAFKGALRGMLRQAGFEGTEEAVDETFQTLVEELAIDPNKSPQEVIERVLTAGAAGLVAGGVISGAASIQALNEAQEILGRQQVIPPRVDALDPVTIPVEEPETTAAEEPDLTPLEKAVSEPVTEFPELPVHPEEPKPASKDLSLGIVPPVAATIQEGAFEPNPVLDAVVLRKPDDFTLFNRFNSPQFVFWFGKVGQDAKSAIERMMLGEMEMREAIAKDIDFVVEDPLARLPKEWQAQGGKAFFEVLDGATIEDINKQPYEPVVKEMALRVKTWLEDARQTILNLRRSWFSAYLGGLDKATLQQLYLANVNEDATPEILQSLTKEELSSSIVMAEYPADWGISDGSYIPHLFTGQWKAIVQDDEGNTSFVLRGQTPQEVKHRLHDYLRANPDKAGRFFIEADRSIPADITRLTDRQFFTLLNEFENKFEISGSEAREATLGVIGRKASKQKWFGNLQQRYGAKNYEKSYRDAMSAYVRGMHRWRVLTRLNNEVQPLIENVGREGRVNAAAQLTDILEHLWGKPSSLTLQFDAALQRIPILRDTIRPLALDRWTRGLRSVSAFAFLTTPRFFVLNRLQPLQTLLPIIGAKRLFNAGRLRHTKEGNELLNRYGVKQDVGAFGEATVSTKLSRFRERLTGERANQELAFLAMYQHGIQNGLAPAEAASYAKLRGQIMTQFTPLVSDTPAFMRGPVSGTIFQYKRFPIKTLELMANLARDRNLPGVLRMFSAFAVLGGLQFFLRSLFLRDDKQLALKRKLDEELGHETSDLLWFGLPGMANIDLSGSLLLLDQPFGNNFQERLGRLLLGPAPGAIVSLTQAALTEQREALDARERTLNMMRRIPSLKPWAEAVRLWDGNMDVNTADGEVAYRRTLADALASIGAFQPAHESEMRQAIDGVMQLEKERTRIKNRLFVAAMAEQDLQPVYEEIDRFNRRWPEAAINGEEMSNYIKQRIRGVGKTDMERILGKRYRALTPDLEKK